MEQFLFTPTEAFLFNAHPAVLCMTVHKHRLTGLGQASEPLPEDVFKFHLIVHISAFSLVGIPSV